MRTPLRNVYLIAVAAVIATSAASPGQAPKGKPAPPWSPPTLPGGKPVATDTSDAFLKPSGPLKDGVAVAKAPPTVDFLYFPGQTYAGKPWSNWGEGTAANGKYYTAVGDHLAPGGNAAVFEYDPATKALRKLTDVKSVLHLPDGHYTPGKIHSRLTLGGDGNLYFATHRGSEGVTTDANHYEGDWILRCDPATGRADVVAHAPVPRHAIPNGTLDPDRLIFYGGTAAGKNATTTGIRFLAYDVKARKVLFDGPDGPARSMILARSTGRVYFNPGTAADDTGELMRFDPATGGPPVKIPGTIGIRAATRETAKGVVYAVSQGQGGRDAHVYAFDTRTERVDDLGPAAVGVNTYVASVDADPAGRFLYYVPGAHGGSDKDGSAVVQFDTATRTRKVIAFLHPFYQQAYGCTPVGTYSVAVDPRGDTVYVTWNVNRGGRAWDVVALSAIHVPEAERRP